MRFITKLSFKNITRNYRRTLINVISSMIALSIIIFFEGFMSGMFDLMRKNAVETAISDVVIHPNKYRDDASLYLNIKNSKQIYEALQEKGINSSPRLEGGALLATDNDSSGVVIAGLDPEKENKVTLLHKNIYKGQWLSSLGKNEVVIGKDVAKKLMLDIGDQIVLIGEAFDGTIANDYFTIGGVLKSVDVAIDKSGLFMKDSDFREYFQYGSGAQAILTKNPTKQAVESYKQDVLKIVGATTRQKLQIESWKEINPSLNSTLEQSESSMFIIYFIIYIALALLLVNSSLMSVFERIPEFGVIKSLGMKAHQIRNMILIETVIMALMAVFFGNLLGFIFLYVGGIYGIDLSGESGSNTSFAGASLDLMITPANTLSCYITPSILLLFSIIASSIYPAIYGSKVNPLNAMRDL